MAINFIRSNWFMIVAGLLASPFIVASIPILIELGSSMQDRVRPIVTEWKVTSAKVDGADLIMSGTMIKNRDCVFLPPTLARDEAGVNRRIVSTAPAGQSTWAADDQPQTWGPWRVPDGAGKALTFVNVYLCGTGRPTIIELGTYP